MKNKRAKITGESNEKTQNRLQKNTKLKNQEQLRKRLKGLLAKDKNHHHLLTSEQKSVESPLKKNVGKNVSNTKLQNKGTPAKIKNHNQNAASRMKKLKPNVESNGVARKRKSKSMIEPSKKVPKHTNKAAGKNTATAKKTKKKKETKQSNASDIVQETSVNVPAKVKKPKLNNKTLKKSDELQNNRPQSGNKPNLLSKLKAAQNTEIKRKAKKMKVNNANPYRGPIRPYTPDSYSDGSLKNDSSQKELKKKVKPLKNGNIRNEKQFGGPLRPVSPEIETDGDISVSPKHKFNVELKQDKVPVSNDEQALTRLLYEDDSSSDESYKDYDEDGYDTDDYEYSSSEDFSDYEFNSCDDDDECGDSDDIRSENYDNWSDSQGDGSGEESFFDESDVTYELPPNVPEDVYIASGTAVKHDFSETTEFDFDSDTSCAQIIEMPSITLTQKVSSVKNILPEDINEATKCIDKANESDDSCPELVAIDDNAQMATDTDSDCCSDCMSFSGSEFDSEAPYSEENEHSTEPPQMKPEIFQADKSTNEIFEFDIFQGLNSLCRSFENDSPLNRIANSKGKIAAYKVITTNNEIISPTKNAKEKSKHEKPLHSNSSQECESSLSPNNETRSKLNAASFEERCLETPDDNEIPVKTKETPKGTSHVNIQFRTLFFNAINSNHVIALIKDPMYIYGTVKVKLIAGSINIFGYSPRRNETLEIFSPRGYSSLKIEASQSSEPNSSLNERELLSLTPYFIRTDLEEIIEKFDTNKDAIVILERNDRSKKVNMLKKYMVEHLFPNMNTLLSDRPFYASEFLLRCIITSTTDKALVVDPRWRSITLTESSRLMTIGGKSVGKSTLVRYLINRNLNHYPKILLIDLDIGQPEMFVPQTVSATTLTSPLLGPGYFLNKEPDKAFLVGHTNIVLMPHRYIESVQALIEYCKVNTEYADMPWIVNTMGYNKGFGDEIIAAICHHLKPTTVIQVECTREINNFDVIMNKDNLESLECTIIGDMIKSDPQFRPQHTFTLMPSVIPNDKQYQNEWDMNPRDMRLAMIISRLSNILSGHAEWLTDIKPVSASFDDLKILNMGDDQIGTEDLFKTLAGNLVYLCQHKSGQPTECLGIGIVRGVDYSLKQIYLLPATPLDVLRNVNCLAVCGIPLPSSILIKQGPKVKGVAAFIYNTIDKASSMYIKQIFNRPQHFLTGRHKSVLE